MSLLDLFFMSNFEIHNAVRFGLPIRQMRSKCDGCNDEINACPPWNVKKKD